MNGRDLTLTSLYATRDELGALIVRFGTGAGGAEAGALDRLLRARDGVSAAINAVIGAAFERVGRPELLAAASELSATAAELRRLRDAIAQVNEVLKNVDLVLQLAARVVALAG